MTIAMTKPGKFHQTPIFRLLKKGHFEEVPRLAEVLASAWDMATPPPVPPLTDDERAALMLEVRRAGEPSAIRRLGVPRQTLARAIAGLSLRAGTILVIREALARTTKAA